MSRHDHSDLFDDLNAAESVGMVVGRWQPRVAGLCTVLALCAWTIGSYSAAREVARNVMMINIGYFMGFEPPPPPPIEYDGEVTSHEAARDAVVKYREAKKARQLEHHKRIRESRAAQERHQKIQGATAAVWAVIMIVTGVIMLCGAIAGLVGSRKTRRWHAVMATWIIGSTACSLVGLYVLTRWGGFPPLDDYTYLGQKLFLQVAYGLIIIIALVATTGPRAVEDPHPDDQALITGRLREPVLGRVVGPPDAEFDDDEPVKPTPNVTNHGPAAGRLTPPPLPRVEPPCDSE